MKTKVLHEKEEIDFDNSENFLTKKNFRNNQNYILGKKEKLTVKFLNFFYRKNSDKIDFKKAVYFMFPILFYILISHFRLFFTDFILNIINILIIICKT